MPAAAAMTRRFDPRINVDDFATVNRRVLLRGRAG
jgi:hypothetical protein